MPISTLFDVTPNRIKRAAARLFDSVGISRAGLSLQNGIYGKYLRAVNYHAVTREDVPSFERHLEFYRANFASVDLPMLERFLKSGEWHARRPGMILSFDDGHRSHFEIVAPLLEQYGFTGWFFVPSAYVQVDGAGHEDTGLTLDQLRALSEKHVVGSHSVNHTRLRETVPLEQLESEIVDSKKALEGFTGRTVDSFCWIGGEEDTYSRAAAEIVKRTYRLSFMTNNAVITPTTNPLQLQRTNIEASDPLSLVRFQLSGLMDIYYAGKRRRVNDITA